MDQEVGVVVVDSHLGLEARAPQALVGLHPTLALAPTPTLVDRLQTLVDRPQTLVDRPQTLVASLATGSQIASLTDSVKEPQDAVSILAQTTLKLADLPVAGERIARRPATRLSALVQGTTLETHLFPVDHSPLRTFAHQIPAALTHTANLALTTGQEKIVQCVSATKDTEETV
jgi:hypothetical protein